MTSRSSTCRLAGMPRGGEPRSRPPGQRDRDVRQHAGQRRGLPRVAGGQALDLLGERPALAAGGRAEEPADGQPDHHPASADGGVGQPPGVTAVHPGLTPRRTPGTPP